VFFVSFSQRKKWGIGAKLQGIKNLKENIT